MAEGAVMGELAGLSDDGPDDCLVALVGTWPAMPRENAHQFDHVRIVRCTTQNDLCSLVSGERPEWLLAGHELEDGEIQRVIGYVCALRDDVRLAMLGQRRDWRRCDRWMRRGCRVYLEETTSLRRVVAAIQAAHTLEINVTDRVFLYSNQDRKIGPEPHLTRRERDVLGLLGRGLRNREIASMLHVSENTVEYHMRHLLAKFTARNRVEVVERATSQGLI